MRKALLLSGLGVALAGIVVMAAPQIVVSGGNVNVGGGAGGGAQGIAQGMADGIAAAMGGAANKPLDAGAGLIFGITSDANGSQPISGAVVTLTLPGFAPVRVMTDAGGRFAFRDLPKGKYSLTAAKPGYVDGAFGRLRPNGPAHQVDLADGQRIGDATVALWKFAAIAGTVLDASNEPVVGATVRVLKRTIVAGKRQLTQGPSSTTDDRGMYRIGSLEPGDYIVTLPMTQSQPLDALLASLGRDARLPALPTGGGGGAMALAFNVRTDSGGSAQTISYSSSDAQMSPAGMTEDGHLLWYQTAFYPAALSTTRATPVTVTSGEERSGIDFELKAVRTMRVSGTVTEPNGPAGNVTVTLFPAEADDLLTPIETYTAQTDGEGSFTFTSVSPGQYTLRVVQTPRTTGLINGQTFNFSSAGGQQITVMTRVADANAPPPPLPTDPTLWAEMTVGVGSTDLTDVAVTLRQGLRVSGRIEFNGSADRPTGDQMSALPISLEPADGRTGAIATTARGRIETSGQFATMGVPVGRYLLHVSAPKNWYLRSASVSGHDITDTGIELRDGDVDSVVVTFTDHPTNLSGTVTDANGAADGKAAVIIFPSDHAAWSAPARATRRIKNVRAAQDGSYQIQNLPPGDYLIAAMPDASAADWDDPKFLEALAPAATQIRFGEGESKTQPLQTIKAPVR